MYGASPGHIQQQPGGMPNMPHNQMRGPGAGYYPNPNAPVGAGGMPYPPSAYGGGMSGGGHGGGGMDDVGDQGYRGSGRGGGRGGGGGGGRGNRRSGRKNGGRNGGRGYHHHGSGGGNHHQHSSHGQHSSHSNAGDNDVKDVDGGKTSSDNANQQHEKVQHQSIDSGSAES
mmetsp:Transcript_22322/g.29486  ORF Transcript_22322/g.29486 Transcript_22322/m.29486 type:complete len:171 (-) Transcript_22322:202-714(-)